MPKKTIILIAVLLIFTLGLIYIAIQTEQGTPPPVTEEPISSPAPTVIPESTLSFSPASIDTTSLSLGTYSVDVVLDTAGQPISGAQIELSYDPAVITNMTVSSPTENALFSNPFVLDEQVDPSLGRVSYSVGINMNDDEVVGAGSVATLTFSVNQFGSTDASSEISFLPRTRITSLNTASSVLKESLPLIILLGSNSPALPTTVPIEEPAL